MQAQKIISIISNWLLRLGVLLFLFPVFLEFWNVPVTADEFWMWIIRLVYLALYIATALLVLLFSRLKFYKFGFSLVLIVSVYRLVDLGFKYGINADQAIYFLLMVTSFYFITKSERVKKRRR